MYIIQGTPFIERNSYAGFYASKGLQHMFPV